ncbi:MAG TPA: GtrA family protein [Thermodesulfovibrionales bacterium]|nr:GtrA family protein [Thermodesulfovibrionales bacterium]
MSKRDYQLSILAGLIMGLLVLPVLKAVDPEVFARFACATVPVFLVMTPLGLSIAYSLGRRAPVLWQAGKFAVTGVLNMLVDWGALASLVFLFRRYFGIDSRDFILAGVTVYSFSKALSFILANINSYYWNKYWTFGVYAGGKMKSEFFQFFVVSVLGFIINVFIASSVFMAAHPPRGFTMDQWGIIGAAAGSLAGFLWNFLGYKFFVFRSR